MNAKEELEILMNELSPFAEKMLRDFGEFHPFGGVFFAPNKVVHVGVKSGDGSSDSNHKVDMLIDSFRKQAHEANAFGIVTNVAVDGKNDVKDDAIKLFLEHKSGYCAEIFMLYTITKNKKVQIINTFAQQGEPLLFIK